MKPLKDKLIQARLSEDELVDFDEVKCELGLTGNSKAMRQMIRDEKLLMQATDEYHKGNYDAVTILVQQLNNQGRLPLVEALCGLTNSKSLSELKIVRDQYADIQQQLEGIMYVATKSGTNLNQIAHVLNTAKGQAEQENADLTDSDFWNWVANQLVQNNRILAELHSKIDEFQTKVGLLKKANDRYDSSRNALVS